MLVFVSSIYARVLGLITHKGWKSTECFLAREFAIACWVTCKCTCKLSILNLKVCCCHSLVLIKHFLINHGTDFLYNSITINCNLIRNQIDCWRNHKICAALKRTPWHKLWKCKYLVYNFNISNPQHHISTLYVQVFVGR